MDDGNRAGYPACSPAPLGASIVAAAALAVAPAPAGAADSPAAAERIVLEAVGPAHRAVVAEGDFEARSLGSYSIRLYDPVDPQFPYDRYLAGRVMPRQGTLEAARWEDLDGDRRPELVVIVRSAGTGGFLHADAFVASGTTLELVATAQGLPKDADASSALRSKLGGERAKGG
jgi:hypothetical protein